MKPSRTAAKGDHFGTSQIWSHRHAWRDGLLCEITSEYTGLIACMQTHMDSYTDDASFACTAFKGMTACTQSSENEVLHAQEVICQGTNMSKEELTPATPNGMTACMHGNQLLHAQGLNCQECESGSSPQGTIACTRKHACARAICHI